MRISKLLPAICAMALLAGRFPVYAQDTTDQAAARAALMQKMEELDTQQQTSSNLQSGSTIIVTPTGASVVQPPQPAVPAATETPARSPKSGQYSPVPPPSHPPLFGTTPVVSPGSPSQMQTSAPTVAAPQIAPAQPAPAQPAPAAVSTSPKSDEFFSPVPPPSGPPINAPVETTSPPAQMAPPTATAPSVAPAPMMSTTPAQTATVTPPKPVAPVVAPETKPANVKYPGQDLGLKPIEAPPLPVTAKQEDELHALLNRYIANEISPDQYQAERAKIMAEH
jgi:hypothetical protein